MSEMMKLRKALDAANVSWRDDSFASPFGYVGIIRTKFTNKNGEKCSVICGNSTYGGEYGLLETMPPVHPPAKDDPFADEVEGWLTADEIIKAWIPRKYLFSPHCPNCGAIVRDTECEYCGALLY